MRALTVNESMSFKRNRDPKEVLGLSYGNKPLMKAWKVLKFIGDKGEEGASLEEIQKYIYIDINKHTEEEFYQSSKDKFPRDQYATSGRASRGYWNTNLLGGGWDRSVGLLHKFCNREIKANGKVKWVLKRMPEPGENLFSA